MATERRNLIRSNCAVAESIRKSYFSLSLWPCGKMRASNLCLLSSSVFMRYTTCEAMILASVGTAKYASGTYASSQLASCSVFSASSSNHGGAKDILLLLTVIFPMTSLIYFSWFCFIDWRQHPPMSSVFAGVGPMSVSGSPNACRLLLTWPFFGRTVCSTKLPIKIICSCSIIIIFIICAGIRYLGSMFRNTLST